MDSDSVPAAPAAEAFVLLHPKDNILVCTRTAPAGTSVEIDGKMFSLTSTVELGHKIARHALQQGEQVLRYGFPIGSMRCTADAAEHVHVHNLKSDYIPAHTRDGAVGADTHERGD